MQFEGLVFRYWVDDGIGYLRTKEGYVYLFRDTRIDGVVANGKIVDFDVEGDQVVRGIVRER
jgi:hypothetical protein